VHVPENEQLANEVDRSKLRREGWLFPWEHLTRDQKLAVLDAHRRFTLLAQNEYVALPLPKKGDGAAVETFLPSLKRETDAVNRVVLIDGGRGSGKTVVLMRLLQFWSDAVRQKPTAESEKSFKAAVDAVAARDRNASPGTDVTLNPIIPIGFIQLALLDESANLMTYVSGYLHQVIESIVESRGTRSRAGVSPWTAVEDSGTHLSQSWNQFLQAIAHASSDQTSQRMNKLDPEAWALELRDAEFRRRDISDRFYELMNTLVSDYAAKFLSRDQVPMFVLAIDDADMRPQQSVRLLNVIRQLNHPRVGFVMTGDTHLFVRMLTDSYLGRLRTPLRALDLDDNSQDQLADRRFAARLARDVYDKVVPRPHRYELPPLQEADRFALLTRENDKADLLTFAAEALPRMTRTSPRKKADFVETRRLVDYFEKSPALQAALPPRLREMTAFREYLDTKARNAIEVVNWLWQRAVDRSDLEPRDQERLARTVRKNRGQARLSIETYAFRSEFLPRTILPQRRIRDRWSVVLREIDSYELTFDRKVVLPEEVTAAFLLASDVAADSVHADFLGRSVSPNEFRVPFVTVSYASRDYRSYDFVWPLPDWDGFTDLEIFSTRWREVLHANRIIAGESKGELLEWNTQATLKTMGHIARLFLGLAIDVADHRGENSTPNEPERTWEQLAQQLRTLSQAEEKRGTYRRNLHIVEWARSRAPLLAAPESGLSAEDANAFLKALQDTDAIDVDGALRARELRAVAAVRKKIDDDTADAYSGNLLKEIDNDQRSRTYKWKNLQKTKESGTGSGTGGSE
jgi:hypothetical protein